VTVAGAGHWLLGHDRIGPMVLERAADRWGDAVELIDIGTTCLALLDALRGQELLVVVDAYVGAEPPGRVVMTEPDLCAATGPSTSIHQIGPLEALAVGHELDPEIMPRRVLLVLVQTRGLDPSDEPRACEAVLDILDREIEAWMNAGATHSPPGVDRAGARGGRHDVQR
jgi:hydrogenase maturation protease